MPRHQPRQPKHHTASSSRLSKSQRLDTMARKKDERAARKKERKASSNVLTADDKSFASQLAEVGLKVREVIGDGNCLFRALADQLDGDDHAHSRHRQDVVRYITEHRDDFEPFIEDDVPFTQHVQNLAQDGTYGGNDSIVAFARLHKLTVVIHQLDSPAWEVHGETVNKTPSSKSLVRQLHISYHNGDHYASVRSINDNSDSPANVHMTLQAPAPSDTQSSRNKHTQPTELASGAGDVMAGDCDAKTTTTKTYEDLKFIERVIEVTHCRDRRLVSELCAEAGYFDLDAVCSHVLAFMDGVRSSSSSTTSDGELTADAAPSTTLPTATAATATVASASAKSKSRVTRRQRKQEKKARAVQRHQVNALMSSNSVVANAMTAAAAGGSGCRGKRSSCSDDDDVSPFVISQQLKVLQI